MNGMNIRCSECDDDIAEGTHKGDDVLVCSGCGGIKYRQMTTSA